MSEDDKIGERMARYYAKRDERDRKRLEQCQRENAKRAAFYRTQPNGPVPGGILIDGELYRWEGIGYHGLVSGDSAENMIGLTRNGLRYHLSRGASFDELLARAAPFTRAIAKAGGGRRPSRSVEYKGETMALTQFAMAIGRSYEAVRRLYDDGLDADEIIAHKPRRGRPSKSTQDDAPGEAQVEALLDGLDDAPVHSPVLEDVHTVEEIEAALSPADRVAELPVEQPVEERQVEPVEQSAADFLADLPMDITEEPAPVETIVEQNVEEEPQVETAAPAPVEHVEEERQVEAPAPVARPWYARTDEEIFAELDGMVADVNELSEEELSAKWEREQRELYAGIGTQASTGPSMLSDEDDELESIPLAEIQRRHREQRKAA